VSCALQLAIFVGGATNPHDIRQVIAAARFEQKNADIGIFRQALGHDPSIGTTDITS
jgi:hypothetical protein